LCISLYKKYRNELVLPLPVGTPSALAARQSVSALQASMIICLAFAIWFAPFAPATAVLP
jgi:hypothetical protein